MKLNSIPSDMYKFYKKCIIHYNVTIMTDLVNKLTI